MQCIISDKKHQVLFLIVFLLASASVFSQDAFRTNIEARYGITIFDTIVHIKIVKPDSIHQKDITDVTKSVLPFLKTKNTDTVKVKVGKLLPAIFPALGYTLVSGWLVSTTVNLSMYTAKPDSTNLSVIQTGGEYSIKHQIISWFITNIWTNKNKINFIGDCRYYIYPSYTYGLGTNTSILNADPIDYSYIKIYEEVLRHYSSFYAGGGYNLDYHYKIAESGVNKDFEEYNQGANRTVSSGLIAHVMFDNRTNMNNSKKAFYLSISYRYNSTLLGSTNDWQYAILKSMKYFKLGKSRSVLALWSWNEFTFGGKAPYFDLPSNGWDTYGNTGRGYIQSRFRGQNMVYLESEYRFPLSKNGLFGGVAFVNCESESQWPSDKFAYLAPGEGLGLRIKMNKHSDVNLCIDYGFGIGGSRGFFFNLGEVF
jgi:hypothetical protein